MPKKLPPTDPISEVVLRALGNVPVPDGPKRVPYKKLREEVLKAKEQYHNHLRGGVPLAQLHRLLCEQLAQRGIKPISYNTLHSWLLPLP